ncbi:MAG: 23S rRNA (pseudouridine(1915)-N(3))-methyltransferase RlmH [Crocinitomicaceae bacterium]
MKIKIILIGKTHKKFLIDGETEYLSRLQHYISVEKIELPDVKNAKKLTEDQIKTEEGKMILSKVEKSDLVVLLDEKGKQYDSVAFSNWTQDRMNRGLKYITFVVGGPYGFSDEVYAAANEKMSLSKMTFSHQMIRMFFLEQLYRAFTILRNEPYHHQ